MKCRIALVLSFAGCTGDIGPQVGNPPQDAGDQARDTGGPLTGRELFATTCALCHGPEGQGTVNGYELQHPVRGFSIHVVRTGRPGLEFPGVTMAAYPPEVVTDSQLDEIWTWLESFPQPTTGEGLYRDYCGNCHGTAAANGVSGPAIREESTIDMIDKVHEGNAGTNYTARQEYMPAHDNLSLTDAEITLIANYVHSL